MPSSNGVYSLPPGYLAVTGAVIQASQHNPPLEDIAAALTLRLSRDGTAPMTGALQLASGAVGLPGAAFQTDPTTGLYKTTAGLGVAVGGVKVAEFVAGGVIGARFLGELIPYTCTAAPALTVLPFGQTLNRITYAALWAQAQIEIAAGNTLYNNGDGSTTFGIPDARGRALFGWDKMGGTAAGRLTLAAGILAGSTTTATAGGTTTLTAASAGRQIFTGTLSQTIVLPVTSTLTLGNGFFFQNNSTGTLTIQSSGGNTVEILGPGTTATVTCIAITGTTASSWQPAGGVDGTTLGASGGGQTETLVTANLPPYTPAGTISTATGTTNVTTTPTGAVVGSGGNTIYGLSGANGSQNLALSANAQTFTGTPAPGQISAPFSIVPPALVTNYILFAGA